jgi:hypothetical protein
VGSGALSDAKKGWPADASYEKEKCHGGGERRDYACTEGETPELHQQSKELALDVAGFQKKTKSICTLEPPRRRHGSQAALGFRGPGPAPSGMVYRVQQCFGAGEERTSSGRIL